MSLSRWGCWRRHRFFLTSCSRLQTVETSHLFDGERLTDIENENAILDPPALDETIKFYHTITPPSDVADILTRVYPKDVLATILSQDRTFMGSDHEGFEMLDPNHQKAHIKLRFGNLACAWMNDFNQQGSGLKTFDQIMFRLPSLHVEKRIADALIQYKEDGFKVETVEEINAFITHLGVDRDNSRPAAQIFMQRDQGPTITASHVVKYLAQNLAHQNTNLYTNLIAYACSPQTSLGSSDSRQIVEKLLDVAHSSLPENLHTYITLLAECLFEGNHTPQELLLRIHSKRLDDFARDLAVCGKGTHSCEVLHIMVKQQAVYPSAATMDSFWSAFTQSLTGKSRVEAIRMLSALKPVIFHHGASAHTVEVLLDHLIGSCLELERCVYFIEQSKDSMRLLEQFQTRLAGKLLDIHRTSDSTPIEQALERAQLARALAIRNKIPLAEKTKDLLQHGL